ncbi:hypothetical protein A33Q_1353 [Indibacter alkaliphilus LW1]|uniref:Uncharacterized protein n=1 Tax=Indibacter alkaliphilus (strain CCUG 57479 / KCTC 22604 / LW1) TaxID=1189612 RepID=S2DI70_INDAL|nr:hypothetical protein [Indibacter alkaliphilus]EOZ98699.1 hypothetical protein A33Q_1353 [Indibacter alkaliphilus LW1]
MKTFITLALAATMGLASFAHASNENAAALSSVKAKDNKVNVYLKEGMGKVKLAILDQEGKTLHSQRVNVKNDIKVPYDLSQLPVGEYHVLVQSNIKENNADYVVYTVEREEEPIAYPLMAYGKNMDNERIKLTVIGLEEPGVEVKITTDKGKVLLKEYITEPNAFEKIYRLEKIKAEDITVQVKDQKGRVKNLYF